MEKLLKLQEAARVLQVHRSTIYNLSRQGRLPILKLAPGISRVRMRDLHRLMEKTDTLHPEGRENHGTR